MLFCLCGVNYFLKWTWPPSSMRWTTSPFQDFGTLVPGNKTIYGAMAEENQAPLRAKNPAVAKGRSSIDFDCHVWVPNCMEIEGISKWLNGRLLLGSWSLPHHQIMEQVLLGTWSTKKGWMINDVMSLVTSWLIMVYDVMSLIIHPFFITIDHDDLEKCIDITMFSYWNVGDRLHI